MMSEIVGAGRQPPKLLKTWIAMIFDDALTPLRVL